MQLMILIATIEIGMDQSLCQEESHERVRSDHVQQKQYM
jgi:hypothetical protein